MKFFFQKSTEFLDIPLSNQSRVLILIAILVLPTVFLFPLYKMSLYANQFPDGLRLFIYAYKLEGGNDEYRDDLKEINALNHYIGMRPLQENDFGEFIWIPVTMVVFMLLAFRIVFVGKMLGLVDLLALYALFGLFSVGNFYHRLYTYGHTLDPTAAIKVDPFTPPLLGTRQIANFTVHHYPNLGSLSLVLFGALLFAAIILSYKSAKKT